MDNFRLDDVKLADELFLDRADGDTEYTLATTEDIDDFIRTVGGIDGCAVRKKGYITERAVALQLIAQDLDGGADALQAHPRVEKTLDDLELD